jgi:hypothetical protein
MFLGVQDLRQLLRELALGKQLFNVCGSELAMKLALTDGVIPEPESPRTSGSAGNSIDPE